MHLLIYKMVYNHTLLIHYKSHLWWLWFITFVNTRRKKKSIEILYNILLILLNFIYFIKFPPVCDRRGSQRVNRCFKQLWRENATYKITYRRCRGKTSYVHFCVNSRCLYHHISEFNSLYGDTIILNSPKNAHAKFLHDSRDIQTRMKIFE